VKRDWANIYPFSDDFKRWDSSKWGDQPSYATLSDGGLSISSTAGSENDLASQGPYAWGGGYAVSTAMRPLPSDGFFIDAAGLGYQYAPHTIVGDFVGSSSVSGDSLSDGNDPNGDVSTSVTGYDPDHAHVYTAARTVDGVPYFWADGSAPVRDTGATASTSPLGAFIYAVNLTNTDYTPTFTWIKVRPWIAVEPSVAAGAALQADGTPQPTDTPTATDTVTDAPSPTPTDQIDAVNGPTTLHPDANGSLIRTVHAMRWPGQSLTVRYSLNPDMSGSSVADTCLDDAGHFEPCVFPPGDVSFTFRIDGGALARKVIPNCAASPRCRGTVYFQGFKDDNSSSSDVQTYTYDSLDAGTDTPTSSNGTETTGTATDTPIATSDTGTATDTPIATSDTGTATDTPIATSDTGTATDTPASCNLADSVDGWSFSSTACAVDGTVDNVALTAPGGAEVQGALPREDAVQVDDQGHLALPAALPNMTLTIAGFTVYASNVTVDASGLTIGAATVRMPIALGGACAPLYITDLHIGTDFRPSGGTVHLTKPLQFAFAGAQIDASGLSFGPDGVGADSASLTLPDLLGATAGVAVRNLRIGGDGTVSASVDEFDLTLGDLRAHARAVTLGAQGLAISEADVALPLPALDGNPDDNRVHVAGLTYNGTTLNLASGVANLTLPPLALGTFALSGAVALTLSIVDNRVRYEFKGTGSIDLPSLRGLSGGLTCSIDIATPDAAAGYPLALREAKLAVGIPSPGILIPDTPLRITRIEGGITTGGTADAPVYALKVTVDVLSDDPSGLLFNGSIGGSAADDGNVGLSGELHLLGNLLRASGGFCARFVATNDHVCGDAVGGGKPTDLSADAWAPAAQWAGEVDASHATGFFAAAQLTLQAPLPLGCADPGSSTPCIGIQAQGYLHAWEATPLPTDTSAPTATPTATDTSTPAPGATGTGVPTATSTPAPDQGPTPTPQPDNPDAATGPSAPPSVLVAGRGQITADVPQGAFGSFLLLIPEPPCAVTVSSGADIGTFHFSNGHADTYPSGLKGNFALNVCNNGWVFDKNIFISSNGVDWDDGTVTRYTLLQDPDAPAFPVAMPPPAASSGLAPQASRLARALLGTLPGAAHLGLMRVAGQRQGVLKAPRLPRGTVRGQGTLDAPLTVAAGEVNLLVGLSWRTGGAGTTLALVAPDGSVHTLAAPGAGVTAVRSRPGQRLPAGAHGAVAFLLARPQAGVWRVRLGGVRAGQGYRVEVQAQRPATRPALRVARPAAGQRLVTRPAAPSVALAGTLSGAPAGSAVALYYAASPTLRLGGRVVPNTTGTLLADPVPVHNGRWSYAWDTSAVPAGTYYVYARLDNGAGADVVAYGAGTVRVEQPAHPEEPRAVVALALPHSGSLEALWAPPVRAALLAGYRLHWRLLPARQAHGTGISGGHWQTLDVGLVQSADLGGLTPGRAYQVAVSAYDSAGHESARAAARTLVLPRLGGHPGPARRHVHRGGGQHGGAPHRQVPHRTPSGRGLPGASFALTAPALRLVAGGDARLPLRVRPHGRMRADGGDYVELSVAGAPDGLLAQLTPSAVNLFAQGQGSLAPGLQIVTSPTLAPGRYILRVTARQHLSGRVVVARVQVLVTPGATPAARSPARHSGVGNLQSALVAGAMSTASEPHGVARVVAGHSGLRTPRHAVGRASRTVRTMRPQTIVRIEPLSVLAPGHGHLRPHLALADTGGDCLVPPQQDFTTASWPLPGVTTKDADGHDVPVMVGPSDFATLNPATIGKAEYANTSTAYGSGYLSVLGPAAMGSAGQAVGSNGPAITAFYGPLQYLPLTRVTDVPTALATYDYQGTTYSNVPRPDPKDPSLTQYYCQTFLWETCDDIGRAQGVVALITSAATRTKARGFNRPNDSYSTIRVTPPGYDPSIHQQGHLLGYVLDGPPDDPRNFVSEYGRANGAVQGAIEKMLARVLANQEPTLFYRVVPHYHDGGTETIPYEVYLEAVGPNGYHTWCTIQNTATAQKSGPCGQSVG